MIGLPWPGSVPESAAMPGRLEVRLPEQASRSKHAAVKQVADERARRDIRPYVVQKSDQTEHRAWWANESDAGSRRSWGSNSGSIRSAKPPALCVAPEV